MNLLFFGAISLFALGYVLNELITVPTLVVVAVALAAQVGVLVLYNKRRSK